MAENNESLESLIPMIGKLQDILSSLPKKCEIDIPQIVVLGDQSVGKSSTLEAIVGKDFLPRGVGMVTRCPILLHLVHVPDNDPRREKFQEKNRSQDWAIFTDDEGKESEVFTDFEKVRKEIQEKTNSICISGVSNKVIKVKIFSSKVIELTLVDLPGITTVAETGQKKEVPADIRKMVMTYVEKKNCIILAVTQATQELNTSQSLQIAEEVDENRERTLCVLTKLDEVTNISNAKKNLTGEVLKFKHGIIGVVNRSQTDLNKPMKDCLKNEQQFLKQHFGGLAPTNGVYYLREKLNKLLKHHINECLPKFREEFDKEIAEQKEILESYGWPVTKENKHRIISESINDFSNTYEYLLSGTAAEVNKRSTGAEIKKSFESFRTELSKIKPCEKIQGLETDLLYSIQNACGIDSPVFMPEESFKRFSKKYLSFFEAPAHKCAKDTFDLLKKMGKEMQKKVERFPKFESFILNSYNDYLEFRLKETKEKINYLIEIQNSLSNEKCISIFEDLRSQDSSEFINKNVKGTKTINGFTEHEIIMANFTKHALQKYFEHVRIILQDVIPKAIMTSLILHVKENFKKDFTNLTETVLDELFSEDETITRCRIQTAETLDKLIESRNQLS